jgi:hypothetical protein
LEPGFSKCSCSWGISWPSAFHFFVDEAFSGVAFGTVLFLAFCYVEEFSLAFSSGFSGYVDLFLRGLAPARGMVGSGHGTIF